MKLKLFIFILCSWIGVAAAQSQSPSPAAQTGSSGSLQVGPGTPLPPQPKDLPPLDPGSTIRNAITLAETLRPYAIDLVSFLGLISIVFSAYHAQFRGALTLINTVLRIVIALALLNSMNETVPILFDARDSLYNSIPADSWTFAKILAVLIPALVALCLITGPFGIGLAVTFTLQLVLMFLICALQSLAEPFLVALAPFAFACTAFEKTAGIFQTWLKTLISILLIPVAWHLALYVGTNMLPGDDLKGFLVGIGHTMTFIASITVIYTAMPGVVMFIINSAAGAIGATIPNPIGALGSLVNSWIGSPAGSSQVAGTAGKVADMVGKVSPTLGANISGYFGAGGGGSRGSSFQGSQNMNDRVFRAHKMNQGFKGRTVDV